MTREEFEARMGNTVSDESWEAICELYYNCTDLDNWDTFADDYKLHGTSKILANIWSRFRLKKEVQEINEKKMQVAAEKLVFLADDANDPDAYEAAVELVGYQYIAKFKIENDVELNERDKAYILDHLK